MPHTTPTEEGSYLCLLEQKEHNIRFWTILHWYDYWFYHDSPLRDQEKVVLWTNTPSTELDVQMEEFDTELEVPIRFYR